MLETRQYDAAVYVRLSKEDVETGFSEKEESNSITNQKQLILDYLQDKADINIVSIRVDDGYTGTNYDRPAFQLMMDDIKAGRVNCVVVKDLSRFGREYINAGKYIDRLFPYYGVRLIAINDNVDTITNNSSDDFNIMLKNLMNDNYCRDISVKIRSQFAVKRKNGEYIGAFAPYGYKKLEENHNKLEVDPYAAGVVQDIFRLKIEGHNQGSIAQQLDAQNILPPSEYKRSQGIHYKSGFQKSARTQWSVAAINRILTNPIYIGTLIQGVRTRPNYKIKKLVKVSPENWAISENAVEPIVTESTFQLVQRILEMDTRTSPNEERVFPLAGMVFCGDCQSPMVRKTTVSGQKKYIYYTCIASKNKGICSSHLIPEQQLLESVLSMLQKHIAMVVEMEQCLKIIGDTPLREINVQKILSRIAKIEDEITKYQLLKASLYEDFKKGILSKDDYLDILIQYDSRLKDAAVAKGQFQRELEQAEAKENPLPEWASNFVEGQNIQSLSRAVAVKCIRRITVFEGKKIEVEFTHAQDYENLARQLSEVRQPLDPAKKEVG